MQTYSDGWSNWEDQLNRKTQRRRERAARKTRSRHLAALLVELLLFLSTLVLMILDAAGVLSTAIALPLIALAIILMSFCAGVTVGAKNH